MDENPYQSPISPDSPPKPRFPPTREQETVRSLVALIAGGVVGLIAAEVAVAIRPNIRFHVLVEVPAWFGGIFIGALAGIAAYQAFRGVRRWVRW